jgi:prolyl-tRNA synthetase
METYIQKVYYRLKEWRRTFEEVREWAINQKAAKEMDKKGAIELFLPSLQPVELWYESGRYKDLGEDLIKFKDRHNRVMVLGLRMKRLLRIWFEGKLNPTAISR